MHKRAIAATTAALTALLILAAPVAADSEYAGVESPIDWRLVVFFVAIGLFAFAAVLSLANRGR